MSNVSPLHTPFAEKYERFERALRGYKYCDAHPPRDKDAKYLKALKVFYNAQLDWEPQLFGDNFCELFDLEVNHVNAILKQYKIGEVISAMAYARFNKEALDY